MTNTIADWEILRGLPGDGPVPRHFHSGHPTPWAEGFIVRFRNADGTEWVGNFQRGGIGLNQVLEWTEADAVVVFANGACYFVPAQKPEDYVMTDWTNVMYALFDDARTVLVIAYEHGDVVALDRSGTTGWLREHLGAFGVVLKSCDGGIVTAEIETDYNDSWRTIRLNVDDGTDDL